MDTDLANLPYRYSVRRAVAALCMAGRRYGDITVADLLAIDRMCLDKVGNTDGPSTRAGA